MAQVPPPEGRGSASRRREVAETGAAKPASPAAGPSARDHPAGEDARLVCDTLAGRREAFGKLVERYQGLVYSIVLAYVRDVHRAEDLAQEVFVTAFTALPQLRAGERFLPWLAQIARHRAVREAMREKPPPAPLDEAQALPAPEPSGVQGRAAAVLAMVEELPEPARETVLLKYQQGLSCREIADLEGVSVGTITSRLSRALAILRAAARGREKKK